MITAVGQHSLREQNLAAVVEAIYGASAPLSRSGVATATGLTKATVSALVAQLADARIVAELSLPLDRGVGRPGVPLAPCPRSLVGVGLEVAADYYGVRILDLAGEVVAQRIVTADLCGSEPRPALRRLAALARRLVADVVGRGMRPVGASLALPGLVRRAAGRLEVAPNLRWRGVDVGPLVHLDGLSLEVANEAKLAALAQLPAPGAFRSAVDGDAPATFVYVSGGVGIGSAIVIEGRLYEGVHGWSGEIGHVTVHPDGPVCRCENRGCLERYAGEEAIVGRAGLGPAGTIAAVAAGVRAGDRLACTAVEQAADALGRALAAYLNLVDVDVVVLGGTYGELFEPMRPVVESRLARGVLAARHAPISVLPAPSRDHAALTGGARAALRAMLAKPAAWV